MCDVSNTKCEHQYSLMIHHNSVYRSSSEKYFSLFFSGCSIEAKQSLGQYFPNLINWHSKAPVLSSPIILLIRRNKLMVQQKLFRSSKVGACSDAHLQLPVGFRSSAHHKDKILMPQVIICFAASCCLCIASYSVTFLLSRCICIK